MGLINLDIFPRSTTGKNANRRTRAAGRVPAVLYGQGRKSVNMELDAHAFNVILSHLAGSSAIFRLNQEDSTEEAIALLREIQKNPVTDQIIHIDLMEIPRGVPVTVAVTLHVVGTSLAVKNGEGSVAMALNSVDVSCLPSELPDHLEIDISELKLHDKVLVRDLVTPVGEILNDPESLVLNIKPPAVLVEEEEEIEEGAEGAEGDEDDKEKESDEKKTEDKKDD